MQPPVAIGPLTPSDQSYEAVAGVSASFPPEQCYDYEFRSAAEARALDQAFAEAGRPLTWYLAEQAGQIVGYAYLFEITWAAPEGRYWCVIRVQPAAQRQGIGERLYQCILGELARLGALALSLQIHEALDALIAPLQRRGFREQLRSWMFVLDPRACELASFAHAFERLRGLTITTLADDQASGVDWLPRLYQLHTTASRDVPIPGHPIPAPPLEWFAAHIGAQPEACFLARDGERYVGESYLHTSPNEPDVLDQKITVVDRAYRGRGIALALKLKTIAYSQQHGYAEIRTGVESNNASMLAINAKLGFVQQPGLILFER